MYFKDEIFKIWILNKLLGDVTLLRVIPGVTWTQPIYVCVCVCVCVCGRHAWFGEYASTEWTGVEKMSHHLVLWSRNYEYSILTWKDLILLPEYEFRV